jgi:hypothetical protein
LPVGRQKSGNLPPRHLPKKPRISAKKRGGKKHPAKKMQLCGKKLPDGNKGGSR